MLIIPLHGATCKTHTATHINVRPTKLNPTLGGWGSSPFSSVCSVEATYILQLNTTLKREGTKWTNAVTYKNWKKKRLRGLSPRANYTERATSWLSAKLVLTLRIEGETWVSVTGSYCRILGFPDRSRYFFFQAAPQLYSRGWVDPVPDPLLLRKCDTAGNRTRASGSVARNSDH
jgi:hypothetical protein